MKRLFLGEDGKLRYIWRAAIFAALAIWPAQMLLDWLTAPVARAFNIEPSLSAAAIALNEFENLLIAVLCTLPFAFYEHRRIDSYGLMISQALKHPLWEGAGSGVVMAGAVAIGMIALGGMQVRGLALTGAALLFSALAWAGANILVGLGEEYFFRGYFLQALWRAIGFWPASIIIALLFAAEHYFSKPGENIWDVITLVSISLLLCISVLRTGTLWFAVGFHIAFDFMQLFVIGTPNGSHIPEGRMLAVTFNGPVWLTGGVLGTEASWLMYPMIALTTLYVWLRYRPPVAATAEPPPP